MRAVHRLGTSRPRLPLGTAARGDRACLTAGAGSEQAEVSAPAVAGPSRLPSEARGWSSIAGGRTQREAQALEWVRRRYSTTGVLGVNVVEAEEEDDRPARARPAPLALDPHDARDLDPPPHLQPGNATPRLRDQLRDVFRRPPDRDSFSIEPPEPSPGLLPSYLALPDEDQQLLLSVSNILDTSDPRAHSYRFGEYTGPAEELWRVLQNVNVHGLFQHLHPASFSSLMRLVGQHAWDDPADRLVPETARNIARATHERVLFLLDRIAERTAGAATGASMRGTGLNTKHLQSVRLAALEHYADWGNFSGAEMIWDIFKQDHVPPTRRDYHLLLVSASRDARLRNWAPRTGSANLRIGRLNTSEHDGARVGGRPFIKKVLQIFGALVDYEATKGRTDVAGMPLALRCVVECLAAENDEPRVKRFLNDVLGVDIDDPDGEGKKSIEDPAIVNALMRMWRGQGQTLLGPARSWDEDGEDLPLQTAPAGKLGRMMAFYETVKFPSPRASTKGFFDGDRPRKPAKSSVHRWRLPSELPFTSRTYHELIGAAMDERNRPLALHYLNEAVAQLVLQVRHLYSLTYNRKTPLLPEDVPFNPLRITPDMWKEMDPWKRLALRKARSLMVVLRRAVQDELRWYSLYASVMEPVDPRWAELLTSDSTQSTSRSPVDTATFLPLGMMSAETKARLSSEGRRGFLRAKARVDFLRRTEASIGPWLELKKAKTTFMYQKRRLDTAVERQKRLRRAPRDAFNGYSARSTTSAQSSRARSHEHVVKRMEEVMGSLQARSGSHPDEAARDGFGARAQRIQRRLERLEAEKHLTSTRWQPGQRAPSSGDYDAAALRELSDQYAREATEDAAPEAAPSQSEVPLDREARAEKLRDERRRVSQQRRR